MNADTLLQALAGKIYEPPLAEVREESAYPDLANPLHLAILLIDCDTEVAMNGMLGFIENGTGQYIRQTREALQLIGAPEHAAVFEAVEECMKRHGVTWARLREDFEGTAEYQVTSFRELHGDELEAFGDEICQTTGSFSLFNALGSSEDVYAALCRYLDDRLSELQREIDRRKAP